MSDTRLLCVVLNYRTADMTLDAVAAARTALARLDAEIVVVDNASGDGSFERLSGALAGVPRVRVVQSGRNGGFGAGNNFGIRAGRSDSAPPDFVYILNSDAFPAPDAVEHLLAALEADPAAAFAGSYIHGPEGAPHVTAFRFPSVASEFEGAARLGPLSRLLAKRRVPLEVPEATRSVDWLAGASLLMRRAALDRIGLFDERFFLYFEETDLCRRAARAGWRTLYVRESEVAHIGSVSTGIKTWGRMPGYWFDSRLRYFVNAHGAAYAAAATAAHVAGGALWRLRRLVQRRPAADPPHFLRDLIAHDLRALRTALPPRGRAWAPDPRTRT